MNRDKAVAVDADGLQRTLRQIAMHYPAPGRVTFLCIGSDRSTGDAFGPLLGTRLASRGWPNVIGTLARPCDATSLPERVSEIGMNQLVIAVDACLGRMENVGRYLVRPGPLAPARALGKQLGEWGNYSLAGVVNALGPRPYAILQTTSLYTVMQMVDDAAEAILEAWRDELA